VTNEQQVGAHHCEPESIAALLADLDAIGECREYPPLQDRDHRARAGVIACVIRHLQQVGKRLVVDKANLMGERADLRAALTQIRDYRPIEWSQQSSIAADALSALDQLKEKNHGMG